MLMRINSWTVTLGIVGASAVAVVACTSTTTVNNTPGDDASTSDDGSTSTPEPDSATPDTGTVTPTPDSATTVADTGTTVDAGVVCDVPDGSDACDTCAETSCCAAEVACQTEATDAATTDCEDVFSCVQDCVAPPGDSGVDAGSLADCTTSCSAGHTTTGIADFGTLSTCLATSCSTSCN